MGASIMSGEVVIPILILLGGIPGWLASRYMPPSARTNTRVSLNLVLGIIITYLVAVLFTMIFGIGPRDRSMLMLIIGVAWVITFLILMFAYKLVHSVQLTSPWKMTRPRGVHIFISYRREDTGGYAGRIF